MRFFFIYYNILTKYVLANVCEYGHIEAVTANE